MKNIKSVLRVNAICFTLTMVAGYFVIPSLIDYLLLFIPLGILINNNNYLLRKVVELLSQHGHEDIENDFV